MKVLLLIFAVIYCTDGSALQNDNGLRPAKRAVAGVRHGVNSDTYSIHKSREISKNAYLLPAIRDLPQSRREGVTQLKPISTKLSAVPQQQIASSSAADQNTQQQLQTGFIPVSDAFGNPFNQPEQQQPQTRLQILLKTERESQEQISRQPQAPPTPKRTPHEKYGIPQAYAQQQQVQSAPPQQVQHEVRSISEHLQPNNGYSSNAPIPSLRAQLEAKGQHQTQYQNQQQRTEAYFITQNQQQNNYGPQNQQQQNFGTQQGQQQASFNPAQAPPDYEAPGYLPPTEEELSGQAISQPQNGYEAPTYSPSSQQENIPQSIQQQSYEAPGYLPPSQQEISSGILGSAQQEQQIPELISEQYNHEEILPQSQNNQNGYQYQNSNEQYSQNSNQQQQEYSLQQQNQGQSQNINQQTQSIVQEQPGYAYQPTQEEVLPQSVSSQNPSGYQETREQQQIQTGQTGYAYQQINSQQQRQQSTSSIASSQPIQPPTNRAPYQNKSPLPDALNNPKQLTSYDPPASGIPDGLIQPQDDPRQILVESGNSEPYDQFQPVYKPEEYSDEGGQDGYDYSPPNQKFEDGQGPTIGPAAPQIQNNENFDVLSGTSPESNDFDIKEDFNVKYQQLQQRKQQQLQQQQQQQEKQSFSRVQFQQEQQQSFQQSKSQQQQQNVGQTVQSESQNGAIHGPVETIRIIDESNRNGQGRSVKTVQIYNEIVPNNNPGQSGSKTIKTIRVLNANANPSEQTVSNNVRNNNGFGSQNNLFSPVNVAVEALSQQQQQPEQQQQQQQTNNGYLPPTTEELSPQAISNNFLPEILQQNSSPQLANIHELLPPLPQINRPEPEQNNGYLPPVGVPPRLNSHSSIASSQPIEQDTTNEYLPPPQSQYPEEQQNNGYLPPVENPEPRLNVHQLLPPLPELPKSHSHNEILSTGEVQTNNGYLPPVRQHQEILPAVVHEQRQYQAPGYLPPVPERPPAPLPQHQEIRSSFPISQQSGEYQAPGYLPPVSEISSNALGTNNGYLPPQTNAIASTAVQQQQQKPRNNVKVVRIIHENKQRQPVQLPARQQQRPQQRPQQQPQQQQQVQLQQQSQLIKQKQQQQIIQTIPAQRSSISDQQAIYAAAGQAVNSNVKTIRIIHERTANTPQGRYGNSKTYLPPSIRVIRVFKKK